MKQFEKDGHFLTFSLVSQTKKGFLPPLANIPVAYRQEKYSYRAECSGLSGIRASVALGERPWNR